jgi:hypothetical protein
MSPNALAMAVSPTRLKKNSNFLLPAMNAFCRTEASKREYTLVLDLDETLVHFDQRTRTFKTRPYAI